MRTTGKTRALALVVVALAAAGCDGKNLFDNAPGDYEGFVATKSGGRISQVLVTANIKAVSKTELDLVVKSMKGDLSWSFKMAAHKNGVVDLSGKSLKKGKGDCYTAGKSGSNPGARLCFDGKELGIDLVAVENVDAFTLEVGKVDSTKRPKLEEPADYTINQIVDRTIDKAFNSRIEWEQVVQARLNAQIQAELLLPHLSAGTILGVVWSGWSSLLHAVGDLIPFVFPNRWFAAAEANLLSKAEADAYVIMRADATNIAEGLVYVTERDAKIIERFEAQVVSVTQIRDEILSREKLHLLAPGSSEQVTSIINGLRKSLSALHLAQAEEYASLAQAAGFVNPAAVRSVRTTGEVSINQPVELDESAITDVTLQRSYEINQIDTLTESARLNKLERYFTWADPSGGSQAAVGLNLFSYLQVAPSQIRELAVKRENLQSLLLQKVANVFTEMSQAREGYAIASEALDIQNRIITRILSNMKLGITFSLSELVTALQSRVQADVDQVSAEYAYYVSVSKVNRLLFAGPYARLAPGAERLAATQSSPVSEK